MTCKSNLILNADVLILSLLYYSSFLLSLSTYQCHGNYLCVCNLLQFASTLFRFIFVNKYSVVVEIICIKFLGISINAMKTVMCCVTIEFMLQNVSWCKRNTQQILVRCPTCSCIKGKLRYTYILYMLFP